MKHHKSVVVAGHICLDVIPDLSHLPSGQFGTLFQPGQLITAGKVEFSTGGPVSNTGLALHQLGVPTRLSAKVGDDSFGQVIIDLIDPELTHGVTRSQQESTSYSVIISPPETDRIFLHFPGANDTFCAADIDYELVAAAHLFHFGYPPIMRRMYEEDGAELTAVFQRAKATGVTTSLDMAVPDPASPGGQADWRKILEHTLPFVDIFSPSIEEILYMLRRDLFEELKETGIVEQATPELLIGLSDDLLHMGVKILLLKLGHRGLYLQTSSAGQLAQMGRAVPKEPANWADRTLWAPCFQVQVAGTTGAGDATIAGFIASLLRELSPEEALTTAVAVGACNVEAADALSGLQSWAATQDRLSRPWVRLPLDLSAYGWRKTMPFDLWEPRMRLDQS
ncbi:MAG: carbohydrate kinase family protein [Candidatus Promineifilaceae bacterium]|nr:carbohydrate kinase family protein [Candidatus Promineifilaceae bacterium]